MDFIMKPTLAVYHTLKEKVTFLYHHLFRMNRTNAHLVKHTDSTDIPVCLNKNARSHKTMSGLAAWGYSGKGHYYELKLHLPSDLFTPHYEIGLNIVS